MTNAQTKAVDEKTGFNVPTFEEYLYDCFIDENKGKSPAIIIQDFDKWVLNLTSDQWLKYGDKYGLGLLSNLIRRVERILKGD